MNKKPKGHVDRALQKEYEAYRQGLRTVMKPIHSIATEAFVEPVSIEEFASSIRPLVATYVYDGYFDH